MSSWDNLIKYINSKDIGYIVERKEIMNLNNEGKLRNTTTDNMRLWLTNCEYLKHIDKGKYKILKHINPNVSSSEIKKRSYNYEYRMNQERFEKLSEILYEDKCNNGELFEYAK